jgi:endonuclease YncB( thermonuclease family)
VLRSEEKIVRFSVPLTAPVGAFLLLAAATPSAAPCPQGILTGLVTSVRDGNTVEVATVPILLDGLAAPEHGDPGGAAATQAMIALVKGRVLRCELSGEQMANRCIGICYLEGADIAAEMMSAGKARNCPKLSVGGCPGP